MAQKKSTSRSREAVTREMVESARKENSKYVNRQERHNLRGPTYSETPEYERLWPDGVVTARRLTRLKGVPVRGGAVVPGVPAMKEVSVTARRIRKSTKKGR